MSALLQHLTVDELKELLNNNEKEEDMMKEDSRIKVLENTRDTLIASNKSLAEFNLAREPAYREARQALSEAHKAALEVKKEVEEKREQLNELSRQTSLDTTLALIQTAAAEADEESEVIAQQFLSNEIPVDVFLTQFIAKRKSAHSRRVKTEKLIEYIRNQQRSHGGHLGMSPTSGPVRPAPLPPTSTGGFQYPSATGMPQPHLPFAAYPPYQ